MSRTFRACLSLILLVAPLALRAQRSGDFILVARRSTAEILDAATLETVTRIHFDFLVERMSGVAGTSMLNVDGYQRGGSCCKHYKLNLATLELNEVASASAVSGVISPDGLWRARLNSFRQPSLEIQGLNDRGPARKLIPPGLPPEDKSGNWAAKGAWLGDRFYFYVQRPDDPGLLWTVLPGAASLESGIPVQRFNEAPGCNWPLPETKGILAAGGHLILYEPFGNRNTGTRHCEGIAGGAWMLDPATGRLIRQFASEFHFTTLIADRTQSTLFGTALGGKDSLGETEQLVRIDPLGGKVVKARTLGPGESLVIAVSNLLGIPAGDVNPIR